MSDYAGFVEMPTQIYSLQENFFEATDMRYFMVDEVQAGFENLRKLGPNKPNVVDALYADKQNAPSKDGTKDPERIILSNQTARPQEMTEGIKILMQEGMRDILSVDTKREARLCLGTMSTGTERRTMCPLDYRLNVRAMVRKIPGFYYTGDHKAKVFCKGLISEP